LLNTAGCYQLRINLEQYHITTLQNLLYTCSIKNPFVIAGLNLSLIYLKKPKNKPKIRLKKAGVFFRYEEKGNFPKRG